MFSLFKSNSQDFFLGKYKKPEILTKLEEYQAKGSSWECLGFYIDFDHHYSITPLDVIPFAGTGGDGIHFGFLTDFENEKDLENTPIVCVSPSNDPPVKLVANSLKDFLKIVMVIGDAEFLNEDYESEEEVKTRLKDWDKISEKDWQGNPLPQSEIDEAKKRLELILKQRDNLRVVLANQMEISPMDSVFSYIQQIRADRTKKITLTDSYDIGIIFECNDSEIKQYEYGEKDSSKIKDYLKEASKCERIQFYRNSTYHFILSEEYDKEIKKIIIESLRNDGFNRESKILNRKYK